jgi:hypothetical protein
MILVVDAVRLSGCLNRGLNLTDADQVIVLIRVLYFSARLWRILLTPGDFQSPGFLFLCEGIDIV